MSNPKPASPLTRRGFLASLGASSIAVLSNAASHPNKYAPLPLHAIGLTTSSLELQTGVGPEKPIDLMELPRFIKNETGLTIIDINTTTLVSHDAKHIASFRKAVDDAGCIVTNVKINIRESIDVGSEDERIRALREYQRWVDAAVVLGARWIRPLPARTRPHMQTWQDMYSRLCDYAEPKGIKVLVENFRWIQGEPLIIPEMIRSLNYRIGAQPDTLNWVDHLTRIKGLEAAFPFAESCDFKASEISLDGQHSSFNLRECFDIGVKAGFRGPWCIEHTNRTLSGIIRELRLIAGWLKEWSASLE